jgi:fermentation-respiration switch protein FrsA (DUF1100 family)
MRHRSRAILSRIPPVGSPFVEEKSVDAAMKKPKPSRRKLNYWRNLSVFALGTMIAGLAITFYGILPFKYAYARAHPFKMPVCCRTPLDWGFAFEDVSFPSADGTLLKGWYIRSQNGAAVILAHGLGGNRISGMGQGIALAEEGFGVLLLDLRAHGESGGTTIIFGGADIQAGVGFLQDQPDVRQKKIGVLGISLGGLQAIQAAAATEEIAGIITDGAAPNEFEDLPTPNRLLHWLDLPFQWVMFRFLISQGVPGPISAIAAIRRIAPRPILLIAGARSDYERDQQRKFFQASGEGCSLWEVPEAGHTESWDRRKEEYRRRMVSFFQETLR